MRSFPLERQLHPGWKVQPAGEFGHLLGDMGLDLAFHKIAMRPGKPLLFGRIQTGKNTTPIMGLPGNPVAAMVCSIMFLGPALAALQGLPVELPLFRDLRRRVAGRR